MLHLHGSVHFDMPTVSGADMHEIYWQPNLAATFAQNAHGRSSRANPEGAEFPTSVLVAGYGKTTQILRQPFRTYYSELDPQLHSATSKTFIGALFGQLGLTNIADPADKDGSGYPQLSAEYTVKADPDLVFLADTKCCGQSETAVAKRPGWSGLTAVKDHRVIALDDDVASRWGPRVVQLVQAAAKAVKAVPAS